MKQDILALIERYGAACRAEGMATVQFAQTKKAADSLLEVLKQALAGGSGSVEKSKKKADPVAVGG